MELKVALSYAKRLRNKGTYLPVLSHIERRFMAISFMCGENWWDCINPVGPNKLNKSYFNSGTQLVSGQPLCQLR